MLKGIKIRLYLDKNQIDYINNLLGSYRFVYNQCLNIKKQKYTEENLSYGLKELGNYFHQDLTKNGEYSWLQEHNTKVLKQSIIDLLDSYKRFFVNGTGFPKFKSRKETTQSCRFPVETFSKRNDYGTGRLTITKDLKNVKFRCSKEYKEILINNKLNIKSGTLTKTKSGKFYLSILVDVPFNKVIPEPNNDFIGLDLGIKDFIVTSNGDKFENIKIKRNNQKKLKKLHQDLSKKVNGGKNKEKSRIKLSRFYEKLNNKKENYLHHVVNQLINDNQVIIIEDLNVKGMLKNHNLSRSIQELSLYKFKEMLRYKCEWYGRDLIEIDRFFPSSKLCNCCGFKNNSLTLKDRVWTCSGCGVKHDRDFNSSINILNEGKRLLNNKIPTRSGKLKPLEMDR